MDIPIRDVSGEFIRQFGSTDDRQLIDAAKAIRVALAKGGHTLADLAHLVATAGATAIRSVIDIPTRDVVAAAIRRFADDREIVDAVKEIRRALATGGYTLDNLADVVECAGIPKCDREAWDEEILKPRSPGETRAAIVSDVYETWLEIDKEWVERRKASPESSVIPFAEARAALLAGRKRKPPRSP
jgi:hypothetical protein